MKKSYGTRGCRIAIVLLAGLTATSSALGQSEPSTLPEVLITGPRPEDPALPPGIPLTAVRVSATPEVKAHAGDAGALLRDVSGAAVVRNGPQTSILQLRGLSGDRVKVSVDGMTLTPACPNHMDPPLHYAAPGNIGAMDVIAGFTPVSLGGDSIGGTVLVQSPPLPFAAGSEILRFGELGSRYRGADNGYAVYGEAGAATGDQSVAYSGSWQTGGSTRFPGGHVRDSGYGTQHHLLRAAFSTKSGLWDIDTGLSRTRDTGTPALTMDMIKDDGYRVGLEYAGQPTFGSLSARFYHHGVSHQMNNYSLRPLATGMMPMVSNANSGDFGFNLDTSMPRGRHTLRTGAGFHLNELKVDQENTVTDMNQDTFNHARRARVGIYGEWQADWSPRWTTQLGLRNDTVVSTSGDIGHFYPNSAADAATFNGRNHDFVASNVDVTITARFTANSYSTYELGFARKNRAPSVLELYLWTPLSASAGQADGRTYLGNLSLDSETSHQLSVTGDWHGTLWRVTATPFYNFVTDYIQGVPVPYNATAVLQFQNLDRADLYGIDTSARYDFNEHVSLRAVLSYVRGRDRDNHDNLYRIAPLHGTFALDHRWRAWKNEVALVWADSQNEVAGYNDEKPTSGYAVLNVGTGYTIRERFSLLFGVENLLDNKYVDHLGGVNRVLDSDVDVGAHIPNPGCFVYVSLRYEL